MHSCYICIGSNTEPQVHLAWARAELSTHFPDIVFGDEVVSKPYGLQHNLSLFHNQTACFRSSLTADELQALFKDMERRAGRLPEHKCMETVLLDIDLICFDDEILKPSDIGRSYMRFPTFR